MTETPGEAWLDDLWERMRPDAQRKIQVIAGAVEAGASSMDQTARHAAWEEAHRLAGSLGTYGLRDAGEAAAELERLLAEGGPPPDQQRLGALVDRLRKAVDP